MGGVSTSNIFNFKVYNTAPTQTTLECRLDISNRAGATYNHYFTTVKHQWTPTAQQMFSLIDDEVEDNLKSTEKSKIPGILAELSEMLQM